MHITRQQLIRTLLIFLVEFSLLFSFYFWLVKDIQIFFYENVIIFVIIICFVTTLFTLLSISKLYEAFNLLKDLGLMQQSSTSLTVRFPKHGDKIALFGEILPLNNQLISSPFTKTNCLLYNYSVFYYRYSQTSQRTYKKIELDYVGLRLIPSYIQSEAGQIKLLGSPGLEGFETKEFSNSSETINIYANAATFISSTIFEPLNKFSINDFYKYIMSLMADADGAVQKDIKFTDQPLVDINTRLLSEQIVEPGTQVCAIGAWDNEQKALTLTLKVPTLKLIKGSKAEIIKAQKKKFIGSLLLGVAIFLVIHLILVGIKFYTILLSSLIYIKQT